jgi:hypothetical protein
MTPGENRGFFGFIKLVSAHFANDAFCGVWRFGRGIVPVFPFAPFAGYLRPVWAVIFPRINSGAVCCKYGAGRFGGKIVPPGYLIAPFGPV